MPNRVIKDSIWSSPTLAKLPLDVQLHWPRLLLMADDWGCFNADADVILGLVYPKMKGMTTRKVDDLLAQYVSAGLLFLWADVERRWGFFTSWNGHQYCNATNLDDGGKQQRHRRRTPEPPEKDLSAHLKDHSLINHVFSGKLEQSRAACNNSIIPIPNPNPNPNPKEPPLPPKGKLASIDLPDWLPLDIWNAYLDMRKSMKRPLAAQGQALAVKKLDTLRVAGHDITAILEQSVFHSWQGLFAPKENSDGRQEQHGRGLLPFGKSGSQTAAPGKYAHLGTVFDPGGED